MQNTTTATATTTQPRYRIVYRLCAGGIEREDVYPAPSKRNALAQFRQAHAPGCILVSVVKTGTPAGTCKACGLLLADYDGGACPRCKVDQAEYGPEDDNLVGINEAPAPGSDYTTTEIAADRVHIDTRIQEAETWAVNQGQAGNRTTILDRLAATLHLGPSVRLYRGGSHLAIHRDGRDVRQWLIY